MTALVLTVGIVCPSRLPRLLAAVIAAVSIASCGSTAPQRTTSRRTSDLASTQARASGLSYARCMRAHGIARFPDPSATGGVDFNVPGLSQSSPAMKSAETACQSLLPQKHPTAQQPTAHAYARLLSWAKCMRLHGISGLPDPRPDPVPGPNAPGTRHFGTIMGDGGYWVGIPYNANAHSPAFMRLSTRCGESPTGPAHHRA